MPTRSSRRRPWPWDMRLGFSLISAETTYQGLMLVAQQSGLLIGKKQQNLASSFPPTTDYDSAPVYKEHTFPFRPTGGMGESVQSSKTDKRYHWAIDCWVTGGLIGKGPLLHPIVPTVTTGGMVRRFIEAMDAGVLKLFILSGNYVLKRNDDSNAGQGVSVNRAGLFAMDAARFTGAYASPVDGLYVAWSDGQLYEYNGTAWTACALPSGFKPQFLQVLGSQLWAADPTSSTIRNCQNDPKVAGSWSGPILIGTPSVPITAVRQTVNRLVVFKADGSLFTLNGDGSTNDLYPGLEITPDNDNCRTAMPWQGSLWFRSGRAFWKLDMQSGAVLEPSGPGRMLGNLSPVRGPVQAFSGWNSQMAFMGIYNEQDAISYLLSYGNWEAQQGDVGTQFNFMDQYDGCIAHWNGRKISAIDISNIPTDARLYIGFTDGNWDWIKLVPYPLVPNSGAEFTLGDSYIVTPVHHDMFQADTKQVVGFSTWGPYFPVGSSVNISYRMRGTAVGPPSTSTGDFISSGNQFTFNGERHDLTTPASGIAMEVKIDLGNNASTMTPILEGVGI